MSLATILPWLFINCAMNVVLPPGAAQKSRIVSPGCGLKFARAPAACRGPGRKTSRRGNSPATPAADAISVQRPDFPPASRAGRNRIPHFPRASGRADRRRLSMVGRDCARRSRHAGSAGRGLPALPKFQRVDARKGFRRRVVPFQQLRRFFRAPAFLPARDQPFGMRPAERGLGNFQFGQKFSGCVGFAQIAAQDGVDKAGLRAEAVAVWPVRRFRGRRRGRESGRARKSGRGRAAAGFAGRVFVRARPVFRAMSQSSVACQRTTP